MNYRLVPAVDPSDLQAYHAIRRAALWEERGLTGYDPHLEEGLPDLHPLLLKFEGRGIATTRLDDLRNGIGIVRLVAVISGVRRQGHGRVLNEMVDEFARGLGIVRLLVNAAADAEGFYAATGWSRLHSVSSSPLPPGVNCIQMDKVVLRN